jgi:aldos-2-ulose dehydratase/isomerase family protein/VCBS repeat protein/FG-GAP repeat protein
MKCVYLLAFTFPLAAANFAEHTVAGDLKGGYQVVVADINHDGKPDLIALGSGMTELVWYENPTWQRHVIAGGFSRLINCVVIGDDIVVASEFSNQAANSPGVVSLLHRDGETWTVREIDRVPTSHRLRTADIDGSGRLVVISAPLTGPKAAGPDYRGQTPLLYYRPGQWKRQVISEQNSGIVHCIYVVDWDGDGRDQILTASFTGIHLFKFGNDGHWTRTAIARGDPAEWPKSGSSDVAVGVLGEARFLAAIEPWHGNQVAVYRQRAGAWARQVIDSSLVDGHTIVTADLDGDGSDQIVAGYRGKGKSVYIYHAEDAAGDRWRKQTLDDGGMGAAACAVADLNGDERLDIACIDATRLKWYENVGRN